ncbi:MAG: ABC transporter permease [Candidatus Methanoplasma sp.]|jgi:ABC-2 type transport system permease protein|nr:ABC transporter permease [Candidatus Methanoplasma sp.]
MNHLLNLTKKELRELLTPGAVVSVLVMVFLFMGIGSVAGNAVDEATALSKIGIVNGDPSGHWSEFALDFIYEAYGSNASEYIVMLDTPYGNNEEIMKEMIEKGLNTAYGMGPGFTASINAKTQTTIDEYYIFTNNGLLGSAASAVSPLIIQLISQSISKELISTVTDPSAADFILHPIKDPTMQGSPDTRHTYVKGEVYDGVSPAELSAALMSQTMMVPIVIMMIIMVIGTMVISSMGSEKENKTLETLLTMPVRRTTIVSGKLLAAAIVGLVYGMAYMVGMSFYMGGIMGSVGSIDLQDYGLSLGLTDWILIAVMIFLAIFCALGLCMILGAFTKNYKAAQTMMLPISVLAMIPMFITMFTSWGSLPALMQAFLFAIPFSHPMMVMSNLMFGNMTLVLAGIAYLSVFTLVIIFITVKLYKSDILLTGIGQTKAAKTFKAFGVKRRP